MRQIAALLAALFGVTGCAQIVDLNNNIILDLDANIVFVTSTMQSANYGGLAGADRLCQTKAEAARLAGRYVAWLSTNTKSALSRLDPAVGWKRPDGKEVANMPRELAAGVIFYPIRLTEFGEDVYESAVHTATGPDGMLDVGNTTTCTDYTVADDRSITVGSSSGASLLFTATIDQQTCAMNGRLYCFGVSKQTWVAPLPPPAFRRAFVTKGDWDPTGGIQSADMLCNSEASAYGLPGNYMALLATTTASAASRFNTADTTGWSRIDGVELAPTAAELFSLDYWETALTVFADGKYDSQGTLIVAGGASSLTSMGTSELTCDDWSKSTGTFGAGINGATRVGTLFAVQTDANCGTPARLACLQNSM